MGKHIIAWGRPTTPPGARFIVIWGGDVGTIPAGWELCDGGGDRPDCRDGFVLGSRGVFREPAVNISNFIHRHDLTVPLVDDEGAADPQTFALIATLLAGDSTLDAPNYEFWPRTGVIRLLIDSELIVVTDASMHPWPLARAQEGTLPADHFAGALVIPPVHTHSLEQGLGASGHAATEGGDWVGVGTIDYSGDGPHDHNYDRGDVLGTDPHAHEAGGTPETLNLSFDTRQPYYALAYIKAVNPVALPLGAIAYWDDPFHEPPSGYAVCDGFRGTPNLLGAFPFGAGAHLALLEIKAATEMDFSHGHTSEYALSSTGHDHDYSGISFSTRTDPYTGTKTGQSGGGPVGINAPNHFHPMELHTGGLNPGLHQHAMTFALMEQIITFGYLPSYQALLPIMRVS